MSKPFRYTGIEGGCGSLQTQNWLLGIRRQTNRTSHLTGERAPPQHQQSKGPGPAVKKLTVKFPRGQRPVDLIAVLLAFEGDDEPSMHGTWNKCEALRKCGLVTMMKEPHSMHSSGRDNHNVRQYYGIGALYQITQAGRDFCDELRAKGRE